MASSLDSKPSLLERCELGPMRARNVWAGAGHFRAKSHLNTLARVAGIFFNIARPTIE